MRKLIVVAVVVAAAGLGAIVAGRTGPHPPAAPQPDVLPASQTEQTAAKSPEASQAPGRATTALQQAAEAGTYTFILFRQQETEQVKAMRAALEETLPSQSEKCQWLEVDVNSPQEADIVEQFDLTRAPLPLVLAFAPNGAITGDYLDAESLADVSKCFVGPGTARCLKGLQDGKLVFLCVQNDKTKLNDEAMEGVRAFQEDPRFSQATEVVRVDPADSAEAELLSDLQIASDIASATTVFLAPPGMPIGMFEGATNKDQFIETLLRARSSCCPGGACGAGGCPAPQ